MEASASKARFAATLSSIDASGTARRSLPSGSVDGHLGLGALPGVVWGARADHAVHRQGPAPERPGDEPHLWLRQRRLRGRHGAGGAVRPAPAAAPDAAPL